MQAKQSPQETNAFFSNLAQYKDVTFSSYNHIINTIDNSLAAQNIDCLLSLIQYMQSSDGQYAFRYLGDVRRIYRILSIITLERNHCKTLFCSSCFSYEQLKEKYLLALFALRRITLELSDESIEEAITFLLKQQLTPFAYYFMLKDELLLANNHMYDIIIELNNEYWTPEDTKQFLMLVSTTTN